MKFGLFYQLQVPKPWHDRSDYDIYRNAIDQVVQAEQSGFDYVWLAEHHFLEEVSHSPAPDLIMAAMAERTSTIRLGHGVVLLPSPLNHPLRVAERVATLDVLSNGRIELGTGRSSTPYQLTPFGIDPEDSRAMWEEAVRIIPRMWTEEVFEHHGRFFDIPQRNVIPKPLQQPHPPLWVACTQNDTVEMAGRMGLGTLFQTSRGPDVLGEGIRIYREALKEAKPVGLQLNDSVAVFAFGFCGERDAEARALAGPEALWYRETIGAIFNKAWETEASVPDSYKYYARIRDSAQAVRNVDYNPLVDNGTFCMGDPDSCIRTMEKYAALEPQQIVIIMQVGKLPHDKIMESIRLFGKYVLPEFKRREKTGAAGQPG